MVIVGVEIGLLFGHEDRLQCGELGHFLGAEVSGLVEHQTVAVAEDVCREPSGQTEHAGADDGCKAGFNQSLAGLEVLAGDGHAGLLREFPHGGNVHRGVGSAHDEGTSFCKSSVCVAHGGSDVFLVVGLHGCFEIGELVVHLLVNGHINFGRCGPEHHHAVHAGVGLEVADVLADLLGHVPAVLDYFHIVAVETLGIVLVESGGHGLDGFKLVLDGVDVLFFQNLGVDGRFVSVGGINVPCAEHDVVQRCHAHYVLIQQIFLVVAFAYADFVVLCH